MGPMAQAQTKSPIKTTTRRLKIRQKIVKIFEENNLKITSQANLKVVNFLDVTLDLKVEISSLTSSQVTDLCM